jgi:hypothetical protein
MTTPESPEEHRNRIVISNDDLDTPAPLPAVNPPGQPSYAPPPAPPPPPPPPAAPWQQPMPNPYPQNPAHQEGLPGLGPSPTPLNVGYGFPKPGFSGGKTMTFDEVLTKAGSNSIVSGLLAGGIGGFIGWIFLEIFTNPDGLFESKLSADAHTGITIMLFAIFLGFVLLGWEGLTSRSPEKMFIEGGIGAGIGVVAGFLGGFVAQALYGALLSDNPTNPVNILVRGLAWAILGSLVGLGLGIRGGAKTILNGLLGGAGGGFIAGAIFQILNLYVIRSGDWSLRMVGFTVTGIGIGLGIGLVTRVRRDAWIVFSGGPMRGKEFILQAAETRIGSDYHCDMVLVKDQSVAPVHALFVRQANGTTSVVPQSQAPIFVNGAPTQGALLRSGDSVAIGASTLSYQERAAAGPYVYR